MHIAVGQGGIAYAEISKFDMEEHQVDLYYYFWSSTQQKGILKEYMDFVGEGTGMRSSDMSKVDGCP